MLIRVRLPPLVGFRKFLSEYMHIKSFEFFFIYICLAPVVQTSDSAIHPINHYPADSVIDFRNTYPLDSDLSGG